MNTPPNDRPREAWNEVRAFWERLRRGEATRESNPQPRLAEELFELFLHESEPDVRENVLNAAFMMWGNTASASAVDAAVDQLDLDADYWGPVIHGLRNAYARSGRHNEIPGKLHEFEGRLTHSRSRSSVLRALGQHYLRTNPDAAKPFYSEVCRISADPNAVLEAEGALYEIRALRIGMEAPGFRAVTIDGEAISLEAFRGSVVCLEFWDSECGPCWKEFDTLKTLHAECPLPAVHLIGISSDRSPQTLSSVIERERLTWRHVLEPVTWENRVVHFGPIRRAYNVWGVPSSFVIDRTGCIAAVRLRGVELVDAVRALVTEQ